ncbi:hypothetical protein B0H13DRAFT_1875052 [Mycena leptocephala]|nr:hypothetical protein B0H13DRAFT_1875052 [Mycena leptocephala]
MTMRTSVRISTRGKSLLSLVGFCYSHSAGRDTLLLLRDALYTGQKQLRNNVAATPMTPNRLNLNCTTLSYANSNVIWVLDRHLAIQLLGMEKSGDYNDRPLKTLPSLGTRLYIEESGINFTPNDRVDRERQHWLGNVSNLPTGVPSTLHLHDSNREIQILRKLLPLDTNDSTVHDFTNHYVPLVELVADTRLNDSVKAQAAYLTGLAGIVRMMGLELLAFYQIPGLKLAMAAIADRVYHEVTSLSSYVVFRLLRPVLAWMRYKKKQNFASPATRVPKFSCKKKCPDGHDEVNAALPCLKFNPEIFEGWDEKTRGMRKSEFNLVQDIRRLLHIPHILRSVQVDNGIPMKHIGWDEKIRGMGKSEFNLVQDIRRLLHIPHILRSVQVDHGTPMKHIKHSRDGMRTLAAWEKSEFNLVQDIRLLLHIPHILRSVQVDHGTPMKHIKHSRHEMRKLAAWEKASSTSCRTFGSSCIFHIF